MTTNSCPHCGEPVPFRWMGTYHCREDENLAGMRWTGWPWSREQVSRDWR